jgi:hypothetical protein
VVGDHEIETYVNDLVAKQSVLDLVKMMQPLDVAKILLKSFDLRPRQAALITVNLIKHIHMKEGNGLFFTPEMNPNEFPPEPKIRAASWPYDPGTLAASDPKNKDGRKPLMQGAFDYRPSKGDPTANGLGIKSSMSSGNGSSSMSSKSITTQGIPGWSSSPEGEEFDLPE